ncbi:MAG: NAD(P)H-dependent glycerol-3-phosphate dehydrogenase [Carboxydocellales bacterium]
MNKVSVLGAGSWATALAVLLAKKGVQVNLWSRRQEQVEELKAIRENQRYLPGITIPHQVTFFNDIAAALAGTQGVILGVPSHAVRETTALLRPFLQEQQILVNTAKGMEEGTTLRLSQVMAEELPASFAQRIVVLSGPSHAEEVGKDIPTAIVAASSNKQSALLTQDLFMTPKFRVYTNTDVIGVELGGSLKNVIALCCGISDGLGFGDNTKAALMTRGLAEITRLGNTMGADPMTFLGLAGVGDLIVTCTSMHSRNRRAGIAIGQGKSLQQAMDSVQMVVEGVRTTKVAHKLASKLQVDMPITQQAYEVLFGGASPLEGVGRLMLRDKTHEQIAGC